MTTNENPLLPRSNTWSLPEGSWDTHHHIYPTDLYPLSPTRKFTPALASIQDCINFQKTLGTSHTVLVQGMSFGTNQTSLLDFLKYFKGNARAFGIVDHETITLKELKELDKAGMKGVRINYPQYDAIGNLEKQIELIKKQAECIKQVGWSLQIQDNNPEFWEKLVPVLNELTIPVITDHYAYLKGHTWFSHSDGSSFDPLTQPGLQSLISLLKSGKLYIKLSAPYRVSNDPHYADMKAVTRALVEANPKRILWGSDWPHNWRWEDQVGCDPFEVQAPLVVDSLGWLETLKNWLTEEEFRLMMVDNPRELFL